MAATVCLATEPPTAPATMRGRVLPRVLATSPTATRATKWRVRSDTFATRRRLSAHGATPASLPMKRPCLGVIPATPASSPRFAAPRAARRVRPASTNPRLATKPVYCANPRSFPTPLDRLGATAATPRRRFGYPRRNSAPSALPGSTRQHRIDAKTFPRATNSTAPRRWRVSLEESRRRQGCGLRAPRVPAARTPIARAPWCVWCAPPDPLPPCRRTAHIATTVATDMPLTRSPRSAPYAQRATIAQPTHRCCAEPATPATLPTSPACLRVSRAEPEDSRRRERRPRARLARLVLSPRLQPQHSARPVPRRTSPSLRGPHRALPAPRGRSPTRRPRARRAQRRRTAPLDYVATCVPRGSAGLRPRPVSRVRRALSLHRAPLIRALRVPPGRISPPRPAYRAHRAKSVLRGPLSAPIATRASTPRGPLLVPTAQPATSRPCPPILSVPRVPRARPVRRSVPLLAPRVPRASTPRKTRS